MQQIWQQPVGRFQSEPHREMFWKERTLESVCDREVGWWWSTEMIWLLAESREHHYHPQAQHITADKLNLVQQHDPILYTFSNLYTLWLWLTLLWLWWVRVYRWLCCVLLSTDWCWSFISRTRWFLFYKLPFNGVWFDYKHSDPSFSFFCSPRVLHNIKFIAILPEWCLSILSYRRQSRQSPH